MKIDESKMEKALEAFMKNPAHKKIYDDAPSERCKKYFRYGYYYSKYFDPEDEKADEFMEMINSSEEGLDKEDWEYIRDHSGSGQFKGYCNRKIKELG